TESRRCGGVPLALHEPWASRTIRCRRGVTALTRRTRHEPGTAGRGPQSLLLPEPRLPRLWPARGREPDRAHALRAAPTPLAALPHLRGPLFRAQGNTAL